MKKILSAAMTLIICMTAGFYVWQFFNGQHWAVAFEHSFYMAIGVIAMAFQWRYSEKN